MTKGMSDRLTYNTTSNMNIQETIKINMKIVEAVREIAEREGKTKSEIYRRAIKLYVSEDINIVKAQIKEDLIKGKHITHNLEYGKKILQKHYQKRNQVRLQIL